MAAAYAASKGQNKVILLEKNEKLGKKVYITGKGRCNITNASDMETIQKSVVTNPKFLFSAFSTFTNDDICRLLVENGCPVKTERGNRVFPESDHSSDVIRTLDKILTRNDVDIRYNVTVKNLLTRDATEEELAQNPTQEKVVYGVNTNKGEIKGDAVILATGGYSYQATGSTGDGHNFAEKLGLQVTPCYPALVPFEVEEQWAKDLSGLSLKNAAIKIFRQDAKNTQNCGQKSAKKKPIYEDFGELLFTHFGVSGPVILSASSFVTKYIHQGETLDLYIDLKPALSFDELDARILRDFKDILNKQFKNSLDELLPKSLIEPVIALSGIEPSKPVNVITKEERANLVNTLKGLHLSVQRTRGFEEAIITQGGVSVKEVDAKTMACKKVGGLYFAGELLDLDAVTGGFNLQIAWSTGYLAGASVGGNSDVI